MILEGVCGCGWRGGVQGQGACSLLCCHGAAAAWAGLQCWLGRASAVRSLLRVCFPRESSAAQLPAPARCNKRFFLNPCGPLPPPPLCSRRRAPGGLRRRAPGPGGWLPGEPPRLLPRLEERERALRLSRHTGGRGWREGSSPWGLRGGGSSVAAALVRRSADFIAGGPAVSGGGPAAGRRRGGTDHPLALSPCGGAAAGAGLFGFRCLKGTSPFPLRFRSQTQQCIGLTQASGQ